MGMKFEENTNNSENPDMESMRKLADTYYRGDDNGVETYRNAWKEYKRLVQSGTDPESNIDPTKLRQKYNDELVKAKDALDSCFKGGDFDEREYLTQLNDLNEAYERWNPGQDGPFKSVTEKSNDDTENDLREITENENSTTYPDDEVVALAEELLAAQERMGLDTTETKAKLRAMNEQIVDDFNNSEALENAKKMSMALNAKKDVSQEDVNATVIAAMMGLKEARLAQKVLDMVDEGENVDTSDSTLDEDEDVDTDEFEESVKEDETENENSSPYSDDEVIALADELLAAQRRMGLDTKETERKLRAMYEPVREENSFAQQVLDMLNNRENVDTSDSTLDEDEDVDTDESEESVREEETENENSSPYSVEELSALTTSLMAGYKRMQEKSNSNEKNDKVENHPDEGENSGAQSGKGMKGIFRNIFGIRWK